MPAYSLPLLKQYTPYSPTSIALYFVNRSLFYSFILGLQNKPLFIQFRAILVELQGVLIFGGRGSDYYNSLFSNCLSLVYIFSLIKVPKKSGAWRPKKTPKSNPFEGLLIWCYRVSIRDNNIQKKVNIIKLHT